MLLSHMSPIEDIWSPLTNIIAAQDGVLYQQRETSSAMFNSIRRLFSKPNLSEESCAFITNLANADIWILAVGLRGVPMIGNPDDPAVFDTIAAHRIDIAEVGDDDSLFPFNFEWNGKQAYPFFTTEEQAKQFATSLLVDTVIFQPCRMIAGFVAAPENDIFDLVLNPRSPAERILSREERLLLRAISKPS